MAVENNDNKLAVSRPNVTVDVFVSQSHNVSHSVTMSHLVSQSHNVSVSHSLTMSLGMPLSLKDKDKNRFQC